MFATIYIVNVVLLFLKIIYNEHWFVFDLYTKYSCIMGGSIPKYFAVGVPYRHDRAFSKRAHTLLYIFSTALKRTFKFF